MRGATKRYVAIATIHVGAMATFVRYETRYLNTNLIIPIFSALCADHSSTRIQADVRAYG